jgi:uncharacterized membrane protein YjjP (DUF1212 family)
MRQLIRYGDRLGTPRVEAWWRRANAAAGHVRAALVTRDPTPAFEPRHAAEDQGEPETYRAMDLALRVGELLLASGETTENVVVSMNSLAAAFGLPRTESDVTFIVVSLSVHPGKGAPPVTGQRIVRRRQHDYNRLAALHGLVRAASLEMLELDEAFARLYEIKHAPPVYPPWLLVVAFGLVASSASVLAGAGALVASVGFGATLLGDRVSRALAAHGVAEFYQYLVAAAIGTGVAVALVATDITADASTLVVGAIMALLPGRALVASVRDGISGSFVSSTARTMEALYIVAALLAGVGVTVYIGVHAGVPLAVHPLPAAPMSLRPVTVLAAVIMAVTFAISLGAPPRSLLVAASGGGLIWIIDALLADHSVSTVIAAGTATLSVGLFGHLMARRADMPALPYIVPLVGPLLPGTTLYRGLLEFSNGTQTAGLASLFQAFAIALALGAGLTAAGELVRVFGQRGLVTGTSPRRRPAARRTRGY